MDLFRDLDSYSNYLDRYPFHQLLGIDLDDYGNILEKRSKNVNLKQQAEPYPVELDDLIRLHWLVTSRRVTTVMEFGVGKSTITLNHALQINKEKYADHVHKYFRRANAFECHSIDDSEEWILECKENYKTDNVTYHLSKTSMGTFNDRICTYYDVLPNICPDLIYLDAPCFFSPQGEVRGVSTNHPDRMRMAGDILAIEHFLLPGTLVVVDGRTANARFLKTNFQRNWEYWHAVDYDQHFFELQETPLGKFNKNQIDFCLGDRYYSNL